MSLEAAWRRYTQLPPEEGSRRAEFAWSISDGHDLERFLAELRPKTIVEYGAGFSTWILARPTSPWEHFLVEPIAIWRERTHRFLAEEGRRFPREVAGPMPADLFVVDSGPDVYMRTLLLEELRRDYPEVPIVLDDWTIFASHTLAPYVTPWAGRACVLRWPEGGVVPWATP